MYVCTYSTYMCMYVCTCMYICICVCIYIYICIYSNIYIYIYRRRLRREAGVSREGDLFRISELIQLVTVRSQSTCKDAIRSLQAATAMRTAGTSAEKHLREASAPIDRTLEERPRPEDKRSNASGQQPYRCFILVVALASSLFASCHPS